MTYNDAKSEVFSVANAAIVSNLILLDVGTLLPGRVFDMRWPGLSKPGVPAPQNDFYARAQFVIIRDPQASLARMNGKSRYEALAQFMFIMYSPISIAGAYTCGNIFAEAIRNAYRAQSPSGLLSFTNQSVKEVGNNDTHYVTNVIVNCTYDNIQ